jgi:hypothetical protein
MRAEEFLAERTQFRRDRVVVPIARKHLLPDPLFFRCIFSGRSRRSDRHVATRIPLGLVPLEANQIISKDGIVTSGRRLRRCPPQVVAVKAEALYEAGIIDTEEMSTVLERAAAVLDKASKRAA